ncbi:Serine/threonine-protein kinase PLK2 [Araneus ventricosus]|uniref:Serine/threonine-protein kinase PLK2 n=1 Tax=Araneus ventricosus TaxID=182803 RepID=A0A4Y2MGB8_ARAVE|nr:Serine/threonine-protein kinase PLK2 [Araneus ventricosus]
MAPSIFEETKKKRQKQEFLGNDTNPDIFREKKSVIYRAVTGGFARVHEWTDLTTGQVYACKIIPKSRLTKPHQKEKILREIDLHQKLQHKNIVRFHHFFEDEHNVYIILENCSRKSLVHILRNRRILTEPEVRYFMLQLAEGVQHTHSQGIIHRDLKLGNMLLSEEMEVKIGDFGLATHVTNLDKCGKKFTVCGTPNYIAPEVLNMQGHSFSADVWAMGCIMYAMLVGQPPFETSTLNETYYRITTNKYNIPSSVSEPARHLIVKMLQLKPSDRPSLDEILNHKFFHSGYLPVSLPTTCCVTVPKLPIGPLLRRASSEQDLEKIANGVINLQLSPKTDVPKMHTKSEENSPRKDNCFPTSFRQKLTNVLCPDKVVKKTKECYCTSTMLDMLLNVLETMHETTENNPPPLNYNVSPFISKWVDYSNKYGFAFQLSDQSFGVMFNDSSRMSMSANRTCAWGQGDRLPKNGTFGHPKAALGDNGTGYRKKGHLGIPKLCLGTTGQATENEHLHPKAVRRDSSDRLPKRETLGIPKSVHGTTWTGTQITGHLGIPKLCLGQR